MAQAFAELAANDEAAGLGHAEWLALLLDHEATYRNDRRLALRLRHARLRHHAVPEDVDYRAPRGLDRRLFDMLLKGDWIAAHDPSARPQLDSTAGRYFSLGFGSLLRKPLRGTWSAQGAPGYRTATSVLGADPMRDRLRADPDTARLTRFVDTNGDASREVWDRLLPVTDGVMVDLKCLDPAIHRRITGSANDRTLRTIEHLAAEGHLHEVRLLMLPGLNDDDALLATTGRWLADIDPTMRLKVIGFRHHGVRPSPLPLVEPTPEQRRHYGDVLAAQGDFEITVI